MKWSVAFFVLAMAAQAQPSDLASVRKEVYDAETALLRARYHYRDCADSELESLLGRDLR